MKRKLFFIFSFCMLSLMGLGAETTGNEDMNKKDILIAYFSRSGNTKNMAEKIAERTGGELFEIIPAEPYSENYNRTVERFRREREEEARPPLALHVNNMEQYNTVFVGYPNWGSDMPHVVRTFLEEYNLENKNIVPFCTSGGGGFGRSVNTLRNLCPDSNILEGLQVSGSQVERRNNEINRWLEKIGY